MEVLVLDGKKYIKASKAAKDLGYTSDYVGQLCRSGKVSAHLIGRSWYVDQEELGTHRTEKKRMSRTKAREQAHKSIEEHRIKVQNSTKNYKNIAISYEPDDAELIPETRKVEVESEPPKQPKVRKKRTTIKERRDHVVENQGEKIIMKGDLEVVDVTDGNPDPHMTVLEPTIVPSEGVKEGKNKKPKKKRIEEMIVETEEVEPKKASDFITKLESLDAVSTAKDTNNTGEPNLALETSVLPMVAHEDKPQVMLKVIVAVLAGTLVLLTLPLAKEVTYSASAHDSVSKSIHFNIEDTLRLFRHKF